MRFLFLSKLPLLPNMQADPLKTIQLLLQLLLDFLKIISWLFQPASPKLPCRRRSMGVFVTALCAWEHDTDLIAWCYWNPFPHIWAYEIEHEIVLSFPFKHTLIPLDWEMKQKGIGAMWQIQISIVEAITPAISCTMANELPISKRDSVMWHYNYAH